MYVLGETPVNIQETLVKQGGVVVGNRPQGLATLSGGAQAQKRFLAAVNALWGSQAHLGKGRVIAGKSIGESLKLLGIVPDLEGRGVVWNHRQTEGADWYFVAAPAASGFHGDLRFRATGDVQLWDPAIGTSKPAGLLRREGETTTVSLDLAPSESVFVMFRPATEKPANRIVRVERDGATVAAMRVPVDAGKLVRFAYYGDDAS